MEIDLCALADHASGGEQGKLNIIGIFDSIRASDFPVRHQSMVIVIRTLADSRDSEEEYDLLVRLQKPDGGNVFQREGKISVGTVHPEHFNTSNLIMQLNGVPFETSGQYLVQVFIDGQKKAEKRLRLVQA